MRNYPHEYIPLIDVLDLMGKSGTDEDSAPLDVILIPGQRSRISIYHLITVSDPGYRECGVFHQA